MKNLFGFVTKINATKALALANFAVTTIIGPAISGKLQANERQMMKDELKKEILEELLKEKKN